MANCRSLATFGNSLVCDITFVLFIKSVFIEACELHITWDSNTEAKIFMNDILTDIILYLILANHSF